MNIHESTQAAVQRQGAVAQSAPSAELEMVVRREYALFTPTFHVTVAALGPVNVLEAFDVQGHKDLSAAAQAAMEALRSKGYRLTDPIVVEREYASAHLVRDEQEAATVVLAGDLVADARAIVRALPAISTLTGAREVVRLVADLMAGAQALKARADAVLHSDTRVESAAILDDAMTAVTEAEGIR